MTPNSVLLLIFSGLLHASWNFLLKASKEKYVTLWWAYLLGGLAFAPLILPRGMPDISILPWLILSVVIEILYLVLLSYSYQKTDLSAIYPIARGSGPIFITLWSVFLIGERLGLAGILGILLIILGIAMVSFQKSISFREFATKNGLMLGLLIGFTISCYTTIDGMMVKRSDPIVYSWLVLTLMPVVSAPLVMKRFSAKVTIRVLKQQPMLIFFIGSLTYLAYTIALIAYRSAFISYAGAIREVGIVFASIGGWLLLKEGFGWQRAIGSIVVFAGILVISVFA